MKLNFWNKKGLTIIIFITVILIMGVFEIAYCNSVHLYNLVTQRIVEYNFSLFRIVSYIVILFLIKKYISIFIDNILEKKISKPKKIIVTLLYITFIVLVIISPLLINKLEFVREYAIIMMLTLSTAIFAMLVSNDHIKNIILVTATFGFIFSISTKYYHELDEKKHFITSLNIADFNFNYSEESVTDDNFHLLKFNSVITKVDEVLFFENDLDLKENNTDDVGSTPVTYNPVLYLPSSLGIFLANLFNGTLSDIFITGRIFNAIAFAIISIFALKILPYKKNIFMLILLMPITLLMAASYSTDGLAIAITFLFIAYALKVKEKAKIINLKDFIKLILLFLLVLTIKDMAYIMIGFIFFLLPLIPTLKNNKKYLPVIIGITILLIVVSIFLVNYIATTKLLTDVRGGGDVNKDSQFLYLLSNPLDSIKVFFNFTAQKTLINYGWYLNLFPDFFFGKIATNLLLLFFMFGTYVTVTENDHKFKMKEKTIMIISFFLVFLMTIAILYVAYTPIGHHTINGYQARYILPTIPLILFCLSFTNLKVENKKNRNRNICIVSGLFIIFSLLGMLV